MTDHDEIAEQIFFVNNGEIDLLTGAIAQSRFDQIIKRDMQLSRRNHSQPQFKLQSNGGHRFWMC